MDLFDEKMEQDVLDQCYTLTTQKWAYYINPIVDGLVSWRSIQFLGEDSYIAFDNWKHAIYEKLSRCCVNIVASKWIGSKIREHPFYDDTSDLGRFLIDLEDKVAPKKKRIVLDISLKSSPTRWWATHKGTLSS